MMTTVLAIVVILTACRLLVIMHDEHSGRVLAVCTRALRRR